MFGALEFERSVATQSKCALAQLQRETGGVWRSLAVGENTMRNVAGWDKEEVRDDDQTRGGPLDGVNCGKREMKSGEGVLKKI